MKINYPDCEALTLKISRFKTLLRREGCNFYHFYDFCPLLTYERHEV